jgi:hypothetical protein
MCLLHEKFKDPFQIYFLEAFCLKSYLSNLKLKIQIPTERPHPNYYDVCTFPNLFNFTTASVT